LSFKIFIFRYRFLVVGGALLVFLWVSLGPFHHPSEELPPPALPVKSQLKEFSSKQATARVDRKVKILQDKSA
jgi:hypothetical protein